MRQLLAGMTMPDTPVRHRIEEYWEWVAVALFLLVTVDLLTSMYAAAAVGIEHESNPVMQWLLSQPISIVIVVNIVAAGFVVTFFYALMELLRLTPDRYRDVFAVGVELWLGLLIAAGLLVFANNLTVIVLGESLL